MFAPELVTIIDGSNGGFAAMRLLSHGYRICALACLAAATGLGLAAQDAGGERGQAGQDAAPEQADKVPGGTYPEDYPDRDRILRGDIDPSEIFVEIPADWASRPGMYAEPDTFEAFARMREAAAADGVSLKVLSAFRSFDHQRSIWNRKWQEREANGDLSQPEARARDIMRYSSMPGTSRHHWGTDLDLNDLTNGYFDTAEGKRVYDWMKANAAEYGFCEVYSARDGKRETGYEPERWHWSFIPTASRYLAAYVEAGKRDLGGFDGEDAAEEVKWFDDYVLGINPDCLWKASDTGEGRALPAPLLAAVEAARQSSAGGEGGSCLPEGWDRADVIRWKDSEFPLDGDADAGAYALSLSACLGDPDPVLRDEVAYTGISQILRSGRVEEAGLRRLMQDLLVKLSPERADPAGFEKPFAALALSEVARTDRIKAWMSGAERAALVEAGTAYLKSVRDYRGFVDGEGWRHGVAHGADLLMQLSLNPALPDGSAEAIAVAVGVQVASQEAPAYVHDEPRRLARPVIFLAQAGKLDEARLTAWFEALSSPAPLSSWEEAFRSEDALARRHNLRAFGYAVLTAVNASPQGALDALKPGATHLLTVVP